MPIVNRFNFLMKLFAYTTGSAAMKTLIVILGLTLLLLPSCTDHVTPPAAGSGGTLHLAFTHAPAGVAQVVAHLTRPGFDSLELALAIADSGGSASGSFADVAAGTWHLRVDALDGGGHIVYTGETDVNVVAGQMTQVALQLNPASGSLDITVTWGQSCAPPPAGLVSWWKAEHNANDEIGGNNGTPQNTVLYSTGEVGTAFSFDGSQSWIRVPHSSNLDPTASMTIEGWIYPTADTTAMIVSKWGFDDGWAGQRAWSVDLFPGGVINFGISDDAHQEDASFQDFRTQAHTIAINAWNHFAGVYDKAAGERRMYVNGVLVATQNTGVVNITQSIADVSIGAYLYSPNGVWLPFPGKIDELSFYNVALTGPEIKSIYDAGSAGKCPPSCAAIPNGLVSWWKGEGNASDANGTNPGLLVNGASFAAGTVGQAFSLNGSNQFVRVTNSPSLNPAGSMSIDAWIYPTAAQWQVIAFKWGDDNDWVDQRSYAFELHPDGALGFAISDSAHQHDLSFHTFYSDTGLVKINQWTHVAAVYDKTTGSRKIYVDGVSVAQRTDPPITILIGLADVGIGAKVISSTTYGYEFAGQIDEVDLWSVALSDSDVRSIFLAGSQGKCR
jgi:hypothetical protein